MNRNLKIAVGNDDQTDAIPFPFRAPLPTQNSFLM